MALAEFPCAGGVDLPPKTVITPEEAEEKKCCVDLPCKYKVGCWANQMPPLYSAPRAQALTKEEANHLEETLLLPTIKKGINKTSVPQWLEHWWYRIPVPRGGEHQYFYDGLKKAFKYSFGAELVPTVALDIFYINNFNSEWALDETYTTEGEKENPGPYWIHNDCSNFRICYEESGYSPDSFTGNGVAFVLPVALPSKDDFRDGHVNMPAALELYNVSHSWRGADGQLEKPWNREWMEPHRYNLGEAIWFNAFRWHSGHVPRKATFIDAENPDHKRAETVGFAAEHKDGRWILFRMCKGTTDDRVEEKLLKTDINPDSTGASKQKFLVSEEELAIHDLQHKKLPPVCVG